MKKLTLIIMIAFVSIINATAQESDSLQINPSEVVVDSITMNKLKDLQRDFDFLDCNFKVAELKNELNDFVQDIKISSLEVQNNCYHSSFHYDLYKAYKDNYDINVSLLESYKGKVDSVKTYVSLMMLVSDFTEEEVHVLTHFINMFDKHILAAENALNIYDIVIDMYGR